MIFALSNVLRLIIWPNIWSVLENVPHALEKVCPVVGWSVLDTSVRSNWLMVLFKSSVSYLPSG